MCVPLAAIVCYNIIIIYDLLAMPRSYMFASWFDVTVSVPSGITASKPAVDVACLGSIRVAMALQQSVSRKHKPSTPEHEPCYSCAIM